MLNYGLKLKELREKENISQQKIADVIGIKRSSYDHFEQQYNIIPIKRLNQIANYFNVSIDYLLELTNILQYSNSNKEIDVDKSSKRLKEFRKDNKLSQTKCAEMLNASPSVILHHEHKRVVLATPFLYTICKKYKISADYILGKIDNPKYLD